MVSAQSVRLKRRRWRAVARPRARRDWRSRRFLLVDCRAGSWSPPSWVPPGARPTYRDSRECGSLPVIQDPAPGPVGCAAPARARARATRSLPSTAPRRVATRAADVTQFGVCLSVRRALPPSARHVRQRPDQRPAELAPVDPASRECPRGRSLTQRRYAVAEKAPTGPEFVAWAGGIGENSANSIGPRWPAR
jgi:hypothetical protein